MERRFQRTLDGRFATSSPFSQTPLSLILRGMDGFRESCLGRWLVLVVAIDFAGAAALARGQVGSTVTGSRFELADAVQLDQADNTVLAQWDRAKTLLTERQWDEAVEILCQLAESSDGKLLGLTERRFLNLREWCQLQLAALPTDALKLYRARVDPIAQKWYEQGIAERNARLLMNVVEQTFASRFGDKALLALGDMALESGDYETARWHWERIVPVNRAAVDVASRNALPTWSGYPDTAMHLADVRARLILASILEEAGRSGGNGVFWRSQAELAEFTRLHPNARGRLGGQEGKYVDLLKALLQESRSWPPRPEDPNWPTFAGNPQRNCIASRLVDVGTAVWRQRLRPRIGEEHPLERKTTDEDLREPLSFYPVVVDDMLLVNDSHRILALQLGSGKPKWGQAAIYQAQLAGVIAPSLPSDMLGLPRFTMTVFENKLFARMGSPVTNQPQNTTSALQPGYLVCLDLQAEGRLLWKIEPEEGVGV